MAINGSDITPGIIITLPEAVPTLRDYFAAKAMQGLVACPGVEGTFEAFARWSYEYADAMLKARDGKAGA